MPRLFCFPFAALCLSLVACVSGGPDTEPGPDSKEKTPTSSTQDGTEPAKDAGGTKGSDSSSSLGPQCEAYLACCEELAEAQPALAGSCDQTKSAIESAQAKGASTSTYESSCKSALASARSAGYCE